MAETNSEQLLTKRSLALSLSPPRAPPSGSAHHSLLVGKDLAGSHWVSSHTASAFHSTDSTHSAHTSAYHDQQKEAHSTRSHNTLYKRLQERLFHLHTKKPRRLSHPHLPRRPELTDQVTRWLGVVLSLESQNRFRDSGSFRNLSDSLVAFTAPSLAITSPRVALSFVKLSRRVQRVSYGSHDRQSIDLYQPQSIDSPSTINKNRLIIFFHGGAWGSGEPWMYRLVAQHFVEEGHVVAIPGYRVYPDGTIDHQVEDFAQAIRKLETLYTNYKMTIIGHSSGAHVALLTLIRSIQQPSSNTHKPFHQLIDSFIGLSGPYDIGHHFDYEAARGVEEISPMKPVNGYTRRNFEHNSPARRLQQTLIVLPNETNIHQIMPKMLLVHGMDDSTVPFTATAEAARILRSCGVFCVREAYLAGVNHSDTVVEIMRGGHTRQAIEEWIIQLDGERVGTDLEGIDRVTNPVLVVQSRL